MSQRISHKWKDEIKSFEANEKSFAHAKPGRLRGFDNINQEAAPAGFIGIELAHFGGSSFLFKSDATNTVEIYAGLHLTMNGSVVIETAPINGFQIDTSFTAAERKRYWIIAEHEWTELPGGSPCTYSVLAGAGDTGPAYINPVLPNPEKQVAIAQFDVPPGTIATRTFAAIIAEAETGVFQQYSNGRTRANMINELDIVTNEYILANYYTNVEVDTFLLDYYSIPQIDAMIADLQTGNFEGWIAATVNGNVTNNPSLAFLANARVVSYRKTLDNHVELGGTFDIPPFGIWGGFATLFTLPIGYRPTVEQWLSCVTIGADATYAYIVNINTNGTVQIAGSTASTGWSLDGIIFPKD